MSSEQLESVRLAYHKSCQKEQVALDKEKQANEDSEMSPEKKQKVADAREKAAEEKQKVRRQVKEQIQLLIDSAELSMLDCNAGLLACCMLTHLVRQL